MLKIKSTHIPHALGLAQRGRADVPRHCRTTPWSAEQAPLQGPAAWAAAQPARGEMCRLFFFEHPPLFRWKFMKNTMKTYENT